MQWRASSSPGSSPAEGPAGVDTDHVPTTDVGGGGQNVGYVHANILNPIVVPIAALMGIALLGYLVGGIVLASAWMAARPK